MYYKYELKFVNIDYIIDKNVKRKFVNLSYIYFKILFFFFKFNYSTM